MNKAERKNVIVEHPEFDWDKVRDVPLVDAAQYLLQLAPQLPQDACIDENWNCYDDMEIRVVSYRPETDDEMNERLREQARLKVLQKLDADRQAEAQKRREQYLKLKKEFE